jgi:DNA-binding MarR family transcriptional regulator
MAFNMAAKLSKMLSNLIMFYKSCLTQTLKKNGFTLAPSDIKLLNYLRENPGISLQKLAVVTIRDKAQITRKVKELERKKILYREKDLKDSRCYHLFLTKDGRQLQTKTKALRKKVLQDLFATLSNSEQKKLLKLLEKCLKDMTIIELTD